MHDNYWHNNQLKTSPDEPIWTQSLKYLVVPYVKMLPIPLTVYNRAEDNDYQPTTDTYLPYFSTSIQKLFLAAQAD